MKLPKLSLDKLKLPNKKGADQTDGTPPPGKKKKRRKLKKTVIIAAAVVMIGGAAVAHHFLSNQKGDETQTYIEASATRQDIQKTLSATGTIQPANQYDVTSGVQGDVLSCTFEEGDTVKKGDILYEIDKTDAQNQIDQAKLQLEQSRNSYNQTAMKHWMLTMPKNISKRFYCRSTMCWSMIRMLKHFFFPW